jgi:DNA-binding NarL/FixJ family response regulator
MRLSDRAIAASRREQSLVLAPRGGGPMAADGGRLQQHLTDREQCVLRLVLEGKSNKEIAADLRCSAKTVQFHVSNILWKTRAPTRIRLVVMMGRE